MKKHEFRSGNLVTVRSFAEIRETLDDDGKLDGLPLMPEMLAYCGHTLRVYRRAERTCVEGVGTRSMRGTVFLAGVRCNGAAHDGCQRNCLIFWKEAWLKPAVEGIPSHLPAEDDEEETDVPVANQLPVLREERFYCQSTELAGATADLQTENLGCYLHDLWIGETSVVRLLHVFLIGVMNFAWRRLFRRQFFSAPRGTGTATRRQSLNLQAGEWVEVKSLAEIRETLDATGRNRGLTFESEMAWYCGRRMRVRSPLRKIISETTGHMIHLRDTVILDDAVCEGFCARNCPRANYFYWREIWLRRVESPAQAEGRPEQEADMVSC